MTETLACDTHLRVLSESFPVNTNMTGFVPKILCILVLWTQSALALEGLTIFKALLQVWNASAIYLVPHPISCIRSFSHIPLHKINQCCSISNSVNPYAGGWFCQYKMTPKKDEKWLKPWHMGTHLRALSESYPMNTNMTGFSWFSKIFAPL